jgi:fibronectin-binding autotransporter adhesin
VEPVQDISYFAYGTLKWGVNVACGDLDGDGIDEIITGPGPSALFSAHVRGWNSDGGPATPMPGVNFFAYSAIYGCVVAAGDVDGDNIDEILTMSGPGPEQGAHLRAWNADGGSVSQVPGIDFFAYDHWFTHGGRVAGTVMAAGRQLPRSPGPQTSSTLPAGPAAR